MGTNTRSFCKTKIPNLDRFHLLRLKQHQSKSNLSNVNLLEKKKKYMRNRSYQLMSLKIEAVLCH